MVPVRLTQFSITEQAFDTALSPTRARVTLGLRVLSYSDLPMTSVGATVFLAHQVTKEVMAVVGVAPTGRTGSFSLGV